MSALDPGGTAWAVFWTFMGGLWLFQWLGDRWK